MVNGRCLIVYLLKSIHFRLKISRYGCFSNRIPAESYKICILFLLIYKKTNIFQPKLRLNPENRLGKSYFRANKQVQIHLNQRFLIKHRQIDLPALYQPCHIAIRVAKYHLLSPSCRLFLDFRSIRRANFPFQYPLFLKNI